MAVIGAQYKKYNYYVLSSDTKPSPAHDIGGILHLKETDTGNEFIWNGTDWQEINRLTRNGVYDDDPGVLAWVAAKQSVINTDTLSVNADITDDASRILGQVDVASLDQYTPISGRLPVDGSGVTQPVSIATMPSTPVTGTFYPATQPVSGTITNQPQRIATATVTSVAAAAADTQLLAANANRIGATFFNNSTAILYLKYGTGASDASFTVKLVAGAYFEMPAPMYVGQVNGYWAAANGAVLITESV